MPSEDNTRVGDLGHPPEIVCGKKSGGGLDFKEKFVGYVDVLGFKNLVKSAEAGTGMHLPDLLGLLTKLGTPQHRDRYVADGPHLCPNAPYIQRDLDFRVTQISDCVVVSAEVSPAGVINLVGHCWSAVFGLLLRGIMCRGYVTRGLVYHTDTQVIGSGYMHAFSMEHGVSAFQRNTNDKGTPFVEIGEQVCDYIRQCSDECVKKMFSRQTESDGSVTALFPFKRISHDFMIGPQEFDPATEKQGVHKLRMMLVDVRKKLDEFVDRSDPSAVSKAGHYIAALNRQLEVCDRTDEVIDRLASPFPR